MKLKQSYNQYRNIKGKHYQFWTANGGADGFAAIDFLQGTAWDATSFRKLDDTFATETLERIKEEIEEEYLILREIKS